MSITSEILKEYKERMHIDGDEDDNIKRILSASNKALMRSCGDYDIEKDEEFKELVFERSRFVYNDALDYFVDHFRTEINTLSIEKALKDIPSKPDKNYINKQLDRRLESIMDVVVSENELW